MTVTELASSLRTLIGDLSVWIYKEKLGYGDGSKVDFYVKLPPVSLGSLSVYVDDILTTEYEVDLDYGSITFKAAPSNGALITASYRGLAFHTTDLEEVIREAVEDLYLVYPNQSFTVDDNDNIDPTPNSRQKRLILQQAKVTFLAGQARKWASEAIRIAATGLSEDLTRRSDAVRRLYELELERLDYLAQRIMHQEFSYKHEALKF